MTHEEFMLLWIKTLPRIKGAVYNILYDKGQLEDVVGKTALVAWSKREDYDPGRPFGPWAKKIAVYTALATRRDPPPPSGGGVDERPAGPVLRDGLLSDPKTLDEDLAKCMAELPPEGRKLLVKRYEEGRSIEDLSKEYGLDQDNIKARLFRLRGTLRICMERRERDQEKGL